MYRIPLYRFTKEFKSDEYAELFKKETTKDTIIDIKFELNNISERWESIVNTDGEHYYPVIFKNKNKQILFFNSYTDGGKTYLNKSEIEAFEKIKTETISEKPFDLFVNVKDKYYALIEGTINSIEISVTKAEKKTIKHSSNKS